tara:strand:- start:8 stop:181 length:174 start_codon:yes stop_codon:yes gene_type:complete
MMNLKFVGQQVVAVWDKATAKLGKLVDVIILEITRKIVIAGNALIDEVEQREEENKT